MNHYLDHLVAQSIAHEREHHLQQALEQRAGRASAGRRRHGHRPAVARQHPLRARLAQIWALSH